MFKFKEGDKVRMNSFEDIKTNKADRWVGMNSYMKKLVGEEGIILHTEDYQGVLRYYINEGGGWMWPESALTLVEAKNQFKPGDKVNVSSNNLVFTTDNLYYIGTDRRYNYVVENKNGETSSWEYCRPFKEKTTYNVWKHKDADMLCTLKENALQPIGEWKMVHTFTI
jgi:hypothetical protein